ncbi:LysR substrate-binding domain-containing protein [Kiloniella majae]|uniref:LysR substrate-binding domain-containing protein n=1 Tax=Kiloniella majae TaxID=1938558 RepID=UPI000A2776AF|nr:LysR substrate-binding domain-containing protein [Kiloniella majae]
MTGQIDLKKLPPLKALKGFEAAARLLSFRGAAGELNLTHTAISHQIKVLEEDLNVELFQRDGRGVKLTTEGQQFYLVVRSILEQLIYSSEALRCSGQAQKLRVQAFVTLSIRWLARRMSRFRMAHPDLDVQITSSILDGTFDEINEDVGIIYSPVPVAKHLHWIPLFGAELIPVCSPDLVKEKGSKISAEELLNLPLLKVYTADDHWEEWFQSLGIFAEVSRNSIAVDTVAIALEMALDGEGVAMVNGPFADNDLKAGRLIQPVDHVAKAPGGWGIVCRQEHKDVPHIRAFTSWLLEDMATY